MMDDILQEFLTECAENIAQLDGDVVSLERDPTNPQLLNSIFRTIHTIKGTCGFLGFARLEAVTHSAESVLDLLRAGTLHVTPEVISDILRAVDVVKMILSTLEQKGEEPRGDDALVIGALETWMGTPSGTPMPVPSVLKVVASDPEVHPLEESHHPDTSSGLTTAAVRVNVAILDKLMNMVGELVLSRNQLVQLAGYDDASKYYAPIQQLNRITTELQEVMTQTRMQPVGTAWSKLPRVVRDIAYESGKKISVEMTGAETELDRQLMQAIQDPLTHMVRNSADHGIELPADRRAVGKPETGVIRLHAHHESGHVIIEIVDDGAGIDANIVRRKAMNREGARRDVIEAMSDQDVLQFVFEPGFSTVDHVTHVSGRGVGMDVVRSNIEKIGGTVELSSVVGRGCTVRIKIPLTLAIISALLVGSRGETFAIPQASVLELIRVSGDTSPLLERTHDAVFYRLRDTLLPLINVGRLLHLSAHTTETVYYVVVCQVGNTRFGLIVDDVFDTQEIVVKPLGRRVKTLGCYGGCTILGDGHIIMILDPAGIASMDVDYMLVQSRPLRIVA